MRIIIYIVFFMLLLTSNIVNGQSLQELKQRLTKETEREKIETYLDISELNIPADTALVYLNKALIVAKNIKFDSIYPIYFAISITHYLYGRYEKAKESIREGKKYSSFSNYPKVNEGQVKMLLGVYCEAEEEIDSASFYYQEAKELLVQDTSMKAMSVFAAVLTNTSNLFLKQGDFKEAIKTYFEAVDLSLKSSDSLSLSVVYGNISACYLELGNYNKALEYAEKGLEVSKNTIRLKNVGGIYINIGKIYFLQGDMENAFENFEKARLILVQGSSQKVLTNLYSNYIQYYLANNDLQNAENYLQKALKNIAKVEDDFTRVSIYSGAAEIRMKKAQYKESLVYIDSILTLAKANSYLKKYQEGIKERIKVSELLLDYKSQVQSYKLLISLNDSILGIEKQEAIIKIEKEFDVKLKNKKIELLELDNEKKKFQIEKRNWMMFSLLLIVFIIGFMGFKLYNKLKNKLKSKDKIINLSEAEREKLRNQQKKSQETLKKVRPYVDNGLKEEVGKRINESQQSDSWEDFIVIFESEYPDFLDKLIIQYPNLSKKEVKIAQLVKASYNRKEMAAILNSTPDSIRQGAFRLRKKLNIDTSENLVKLFDEF